MKVVWREILASVALSAVALSMIGTDGAEARNKSSKMEPPPPEKVKPVGDQPVDAPAEKGKSDTIKTDPVQGEAPPSADWFVVAPKHLQLREATPGTGDAAADPATEKGIRDNGVKSCSGCGMTGREAAPPPVDDAAAPPSADYEEKGKGQHFIRDRPVLSSAAKTKGPKVRDDTPRDTSLLSIVGGVTAIAAIVALAAGGGDDNPTSP